jgi:phosphoenolpyruvate-protein phosphotransferase
LLARNLGLPAVAGIPDLHRKIQTGDEVIVDGLSGLVFVNPGPSILQEYQRLRADLAAADDAREALIDVPAQTSDGTTVEIAANIGKASDAEAAALFRADGVGLFRTEFAFAIRPRFPTEAEQVQVLTEVAERLRPHTVVVRILDIGGDKMLPYFELPPARNPALAQRGLRLMLRHPEVLLPQLRAILRVAAHHHVEILLPMVSEPSEVKEVRRLVIAASAALAGEGVNHSAKVAIGAMIEIPAAALGIKGLLAASDFISVGSNDLVQYLLAADRDDPEMAQHYQPAHPAVIQMLHLIAKEARACGKPFSICGEIAADTHFTALLLGLGYRRFSVAPSQILQLKEAVRAASVPWAEHLARAVLEMRGPDEIELALAQGLSVPSSTRL